MFSEVVKADGIFFDVGIGYRLESTAMMRDGFDKWEDEKFPTAYFALGYEKGNFRIEISHDSNWFIGRPFNDGKELHLSTLRAVYRFDISGMIK